MTDAPFSRRNKIPAQLREHPISDDATPDTRFGVVSSARRHLIPSAIRDVLCTRLIKEPNRDNWSEVPNVWDEDKELIRSCPWYKVYDVAEDLYLAVLRVKGTQAAEEFQADIVEVLGSEGIAWTMKNGLVVRADLELVGVAVASASSVLAASGQGSAKQAIEGALRDLSVRPVPDTIGAVHKSVAAVESVVRAVTQDPKRTLGELLREHKGIVPPPLDLAVEKVWGFASEHARHLREGANSGFEEAELVVGLCAAVTIYLGKKMSGLEASKGSS